ncbi:penicillin acylase family protein [Sanyastnella coralliicola]|uniref:penicillin acylase family protein n=1 Tax=Sanyastnella coralliicola TaxID=3069118 RepID=UPI0027BA3AA3|nr:penicillin acylase family protein [Longitalea sp. SCSIO 12813]
MRWIKRIFLLLVIIAGVASIYAYWYASSRVPQYEGEIDLPELKSEVTTTFDAHGIPHIKGESAEDVYMTLGYIMASERLFQMEMLRRVGRGELAEVLGDKGLGPDLFFRASGIAEYADRSAEAFESTFASAEELNECRAFIEGVNAFIRTGKEPLEFKLAGIPLTEFELRDLYAIAGYMAYSFEIALQTDMLATELERQHSEEWLQSMGLVSSSLPPFRPSCSTDTTETILLPDLLGELGIPVFTGSNSWAVNSSKSKSGAPILCNDTHIGYGLPQVWYEAALEFPGVKTYGNFLPGIPYALVGHSDHHGWGLTMFENDDIDFYREYENDAGEFIYEGNAYAPSFKEHVIKVKDAADTTISVKWSKHGPIINEVVEEIPDFPPYAMRWEYLQTDNQLITAFRNMMRSNELEEFESAIALIHAPGLSITYADKDDHIGNWSCARIPHHPAHVNPKTAIDGRYASNEILGYLDFSRNPQCVDPEVGYLGTANEAPEMMDSVFVYGYYVPPSRGKRIRKLLSETDQWDVSMMKDLLLDVYNDDEAIISQRLHRILTNSDFEWTDIEQEAIALLDWDGHYGINEPSPVVFTPLQMAILRSGMQDKMTPEQFERFAHTHWCKRFLHIALNDPDHEVWDVSTTDAKEKLQDHVGNAFRSVVAQLVGLYGNSTKDWSWGEAHQWGPPHPFKDVPVVGDWLSLDPMPMSGGNETISQSGFTPSSAGYYIGRFGAQMRIVLDLSDVGNSESIAPTGQSGHRMSKYYDDQADMYRKGEFRLQRISADPNGKKLVFK